VERSRASLPHSRVHGQSNSDIHEIFVQRFHAKFLAKSLSLYPAFPSFSRRCYFSRHEGAAARRAIPRISSGMDAAGGMSII